MSSVMAGLLIIPKTPIIQALYTDSPLNTFEVIDPAFEAHLVDSYGQPMKMTWEMMAGNHAFRLLHFVSHSPHEQELHF